MEWSCQNSKMLENGMVLAMDRELMRWDDNCDDDDDDEYKKTCKNCSEKFDEEDGYLFCPDCLREKMFEMKYDPISCAKYAEKGNYKENVEINGFLAGAFTEQEINEILLRELIQASCVRPYDCTWFLEMDECWLEDVWEKTMREEGKNE